jgi:dTDP-4-amino-4,6-dideoxygalactose transaminase
VSEDRIPLSDIDYGPEEQAAVLRVLASKWLSMGPEVAAFEDEFARFVGARHAIAVANGTAALHLAYLAMGLAAGQEVVQPAINFVAAANLTIAVGCTPVFADLIGLDEPTISPADLERKITPATRAVVVMHYGGYGCRMDEVRDICSRRDLVLIEDACHALGARYPLAKNGDGQTMLGLVGDVGCFSFFSNKNVATGEGGMIATNRDDVAARARALRSHGMTSMSWDRHRGHASSYDVTAHGYNYRLDELHGAIGRAQLAKLPANNDRRRKLVELYREGLGDLRGWTIPFAGYTGESAYHLMVIVAPDSETRNATVAELKKHEIQTSLHYPCITDFSAFADYAAADVTVARSFASRAITLPLYPTLRPAQVERIVAIIRDVAD